MAINDKGLPPKTREQMESPKVSDKQGGTLHSLVEVEKMVQLAFLIPSATVVGWLCGLGLDRLFHQTWIYIAGLLLGATAGFVQLFRIVLQNTKE